MYTAWAFSIRPCSVHRVEVAIFADEEAVRRAIEIAAEGECLTDDEGREDDRVYDPGTK